MLRSTWQADELRRRGRGRGRRSHRRLCRTRVEVGRLRSSLGRGRAILQNAYEGKRDERVSEWFSGHNDMNDALRDLLLLENLLIMSP